MKKIVFGLAWIAVAAIVFAFTLPLNWQITPQYNITFSTSGVSGIFKKFSGTLLFDEQDPAASKFEVSIDVSSINTGNGLQNTDAKNADWLDATRYPSIKYTSKRIVKSGAGYQVTGDLQMHGITKEMTIPFTFKRDGNNGTFAGTFIVNRNDFKIGKPDAEVGADIKLSITVPVIKK